jgi:hypothetical protein
VEFETTDIYLELFQLRLIETNVSNIDEGIETNKKKQISHADWYVGSLTIPVEYLLYNKYLG